MKHISRNIDPSDACDLLEKVPHACICFASNEGAQAQPVLLIWHDNHYLIGLPDDADYQPGLDQEVVLLVDDGTYFFDLRAIYIRGQVKPAAIPDNAPVAHAWLELIPIKTVAWDYGTLHEVQNEH